MEKIFSKYTNTIRVMLKRYNMDLYNIFLEDNITETFSSHDNWNGGIDYYDIIIRIPVELFEDLRNQSILEECENKIRGFYLDAMRGDGESIQIENVTLKPSISTANILYLGDNINDYMWKSGYFRLFISHLTVNKDSASNLKSCLMQYGIDCFVAHEDITPSKEWEQEIESALFTMDALCAIVVPEFKNSDWCDQEVGIALGQKKLVISINKGRVPYGFFGKYQALKAKDLANEIAVDIWKVLITNEKVRSIYFNKFIKLILSATNLSDAKNFIKILNECNNVDKHYIKNLHENFSLNAILNNSEILKIINPIFEKYNIKPLYVTKQVDEMSLHDDLPF